jgi:hypothetical protein
MQRAVLVDVWQVLASFADCLVVVGGWTPALLLPTAAEPHVGSSDVDLALDEAKLNDGRYAELSRIARRASGLVQPEVCHHTHAACDH